MASSCPSAGTESARSARDDILPAYAITVGRRRRRSPVGLEGVWLRPSEEGNPHEVNARRCPQSHPTLAPRRRGASVYVRRRGRRVSLTGRVAELSESALSIKGTASEVLITRDGAIYDDHGFQDIPTAIQESLGGTFVSTLELRVRNGDTVIMAEVRTAASPGISNIRWGTRGGRGQGERASRCRRGEDIHEDPWRRGLMAAGYAIYRGAASNKWCVVEMPDDWTSDEGLPPPKVLRVAGSTPWRTRGLS